MASPARDARLAAIAAGFTEVRARGPNYILTRNPATGRFSLDAQAANGGWHLDDGTEVDTAWVPADPIADQPWLHKMVLANYHAYAFPGNNTFDSGELVRYLRPETGDEIAFQPMQLQWINNLEQIDPIADPGNVAGSVSGDELVWSDAFGVGTTFYWQTQTTKLAKRLVVDDVSSLGTPAGTMDPDGLGLCLQFIINYDSGIEVWYIPEGQTQAVLWNQRTTIRSNDAVEFRDGATQEVLWYFVRPLATDLDHQPGDTHEREVKADLVFARAGNSIYVKAVVLWSWLQTVPSGHSIEIDPTIDPQVSSGADDAYESMDGSGFDGTGNGLRVRSSASTANQNVTGARFTPAIPHRAKVTAADFRMYFSNATYDDVYAYVGAEDVDNAVNFTTSADVDGRVASITTATVDWNATGMATGWGITNDISAVVQEIIDRPGWASGNGLVILAVGYLASPYRLGIGVSYEGNSSVAPLLHIEYTMRRVMVTRTS